MKLKVCRAEVSGTIRAPPSKSYTHRAVICSSLAAGKSMVKNPLSSDDTCTTAAICEMLGAHVEWDDQIEIIGTDEISTPEDVLDCHGSGTSLRLLTGLAAHAPGLTVLTGDPSLRRRPVGPLLKAMKDWGVKCYSTRLNGLPPVVVFGGGVKGGHIYMKGDVSSQYITAMLLSCPWAYEDTVIELSTELESKPYIEITLDVLERYGIEVEVSDTFNRYIIPSQQIFKPNDYMTPGDFSSAAFLVVLGALTGEVEVTGLDPDSKQGDKEIMNILDKMGTSVKSKGDSVKVEKNELEGMTIDVSDIPDLTPILAVLGTQARGTTELINAERLRIKESDRLSAITTELKKMGADIRERRGSLNISGPTYLKGANIYPHNDHRIAMACAVAASVAEGDTFIENVECIDKSYPNFIKDIKSIGADVKCLSR